MFDQAIVTTEFETTTVPASFNGTHALALAFIERLATDDAFRGEIVADPVAATAQYGFTIDRSKLPESGITLPTKAVLMEHIDEIAAQFAAASNVIVMFTI